MINHSLPQYTITIDYIIRGLLHTDFEHTLTDAEIKEALPLLFNFNYGDFNERSFFEYAFVRHFLYREIAVTPYERWKNYLEEFCYSNSKYIESICKTALKDVDLLTTIDYYESGANTYKRNESVDNTSNLNSKTNSTSNIKNYGETTGTQTTNTTNESNTTEIQSTFPQATLNSMDYASGSNQRNADDTTDTTTTSNDTTNDTSESNVNTDSTSDTKANTARDISDKSDTTLTRRGREGVSYASLMGEFYQSGYPIMRKLFEEASYLFFSIY